MCPSCACLKVSGYRDRAPEKATITCHLVGAVASTVCAAALQEDAAARVLDPVLSSVLEAAAAAGGAPYTPVHGIFIKDYKETEW